MHLLRIQSSPKEPARAIDGQPHAGRSTCMFDETQQRPTIPKSNRQGHLCFDAGDLSYAQSAVRPPWSDVGEAGQVQRAPAGELVAAEESAGLGGVVAFGP